MNTLIIGGTKGIGWEMARMYALEGGQITVTGRSDNGKATSHITQEKLNLSGGSYIGDIDRLVSKLSTIDRFVYSPGYYQEGHVTDLSEAEIQEMIQVCGSGFIFAVRSILMKQATLPECVVITSSSQWTAREYEPIYNFAKAGVAHFAHALSYDTRVGKLLVAGPTGTKTDFHAGRDVDMSTYHEPEWVAQQIVQHANGDYEYKFIKILRDPATVEVSDLR